MWYTFHMNRRFTNRRPLLGLLCFISLLLACTSGLADIAPQAEATDGPVASVPEQTEPKAELTAKPTSTQLSTASPPPTQEPTPAPISVKGQLVSIDAESLTVTEPLEGPEPLAAALPLLPQLKTVTVSRTISEDGIAPWIEAWDALVAAYPDLTFSFFDRYGEAAAETVETFAPTALPDAAELHAVLRVFSHLSQLDLSALTLSREEASILVAAAGDVEVLWRDEDFGFSKSFQKQLTLPQGTGLTAAKAYLACFPRLSRVDLLSSGLSEAEGDALCQTFPQVAFHRMVTLNGQLYDNQVERLDLSGAVIDDYGTFVDQVGRFPNLHALELSDCSLSDQELADLRSRYPEAGVVWTVRFGRWSIRTDAVAFSTKQSGYTEHRYRSESVSVLSYCTGLIALDLGHNAIQELGWIESLPDLQLLILADNGITDISPIAKLKKLKYVELFMNPIRDISPLGELKELLDVNLCITKAEDLSPLLRCTKLERIWIGHQTQDYCTKESLQAVLEAFPDAEYDLLSVSCTNRGWREHPRFYAYQEMFQTNAPVAPFLPED